MVGYARVSTEDNPADWCTKPREVEPLIAGRFFDIGPKFLHLEKKDWAIRHSYKKDNLEGEVLVKKVFAVETSLQVVEMYLE